jgi:hypothetical protein
MIFRYSIEPHRIAVRGEYPPIVRLGSLRDSPRLDIADKVPRAQPRERRVPGPQASSNLVRNARSAR